MEKQKIWITILRDFIDKVTLQKHIFYFNMLGMVKTMYGDHIFLRGKGRKEPD